MKTLKTKHAREETRTRENGTRNTKPANGAERIAAIKEIIDSSSYAKIDGVLVDLFTAGRIMTVYNALSPAKQKEYVEWPVQGMTDIAFKLLAKVGQ